MKTFMQAYDYGMEMFTSEWRLGSELNRRTRICSPLHNHSAT